MWPHGLLLTLLPRLSGSSGAGSASASAALQTWAAKGQVERLPMLLEAGADVDHADRRAELCTK